MPSEIIYQFSGKYRFLSNFFIESDGSCVEREYQAEKTPFAAEKLNVFNRVVCKSCQKPIRGLQILFNCCGVCGSRDIHSRPTTPGEAKRVSRTVTLRPDWESVKIEIMTGLIRKKFTDHSSLGDLLTHTYPKTLIEGNVWGDRFWGCVDNGHGTGENWLGKILMKVRWELIDK